MYGTVARAFLKPDVVADAAAGLLQAGVGTAPGQIAVYVYQMDQNPREIMIVALFESEAAYKQNAASPEQVARFAQVMALLEGEPEWHDGHVIYSNRPGV